MSKSTCSEMLLQFQQQLLEIAATTIRNPTYKKFARETLNSKLRANKESLTKATCLRRTHSSCFYGAGGEMILKVFLPENIYYRREECDLYGEATIESKTITYYIVSDSDEGENLMKIGTVASQNHAARKSICDVRMKFVYNNDDSNIHLSYLSIRPTEKLHVSLFLYNRNDILQINSDVADNTKQNDIEYLRSLIDSDINFNMIKAKEKILLNSVHKIALNIFLWLQFLAFLKPLFNKMEFIEHLSDWKKSLSDFNRKSEKVWIIAFDILAGVTTMGWLLYLGDPGSYFIQFSNEIIYVLRSLLESLKGNPVGLKLNVQLNNFLLDCFVYHVDLWATFLAIISPVIQYIFTPIAMLGFFGLSFQLAILSDLIIITSLHAHCFHIYAKTLFDIEIGGMKALWNVVLGRRKNVLKNRVESYDYMNRQLYFATILFTALLFLFPTVLVYYIVFASLRSCIYFVTFILKVLRKTILVLPVKHLFLWLIGRYKDIRSVTPEFIGTVMEPPLPIISVIKLNVEKSSPWRKEVWRALNF